MRHFRWVLLRWTAVLVLVGAGGCLSIIIGQKF
jgi:hypothetical protein